MSDIYILLCVEMSISSPSRLNVDRVDVLDSCLSRLIRQIRLFVQSNECVLCVEL